MEVASRLSETGGAMQRDVRISHSVLPEELLSRERPVVTSMVPDRGDDDEEREENEGAGARGVVWT